MIKKELELETLCKAFKRLRIESKLSQEDLSNFTGVSQPNISSLEKGNGFHVKTFLALYNFYCNSKNESTIIKELFQVQLSNNYVTIQKLDQLRTKTNKLFNNIIKDLE